MKLTIENPGVGRTDLLFFPAILIFVYTQLFSLPFTPIYFDGDTLVPVSNAMRIVRGEVIYRDFFHFISPGADLYYAGLFRLFGERIWIINVTILLLTMAQVGLLWFFSKRLLTGIIAFLPPLIFLVLGFRQFSIDGSYRLMGLVFALSAAAILVERRSSPRLFLAGLFCALASFFQQPRGILAVLGIAAFLLWENYFDGFNFRSLLRSSAVLFSSFLFFALLTHGYFIWSAGAENFGYAMFGYIGTSYRADPFNNNTAYLSDLFVMVESVRSTGSFFSAAARTALISGFYYLLVPYVYLVLIAVLWVRRRALDAKIFKTLVLLGLLGIFLAIGVSAPTITRVFHVAAPAIVIFVWLCSQWRPSGRLLTPALAALCVIAGAMIVQRQTSQKDYLEMPAGKAAFLYRPAYEKYRWIGENTTPGEALYEPHHPNFYFPFHLINPTPLFNVRDSGYTPATQVEAVVRSLETSRPRLIIWPTMWSKSPSERASDDNLEPLWQFLQMNYVPIHTIPKYDDPSQSMYGDSEVWQLKH